MSSAGYPPYLVAGRSAGSASAMSRSRPDGFSIFPGQVGAPIAGNTSGPGRRETGRGCTQKSRGCAQKNGRNQLPEDPGPARVPVSPLSPIGSALSFLLGSLPIGPASLSPSRSQSLGLSIQGISRRTAHPAVTGSFPGHHAKSSPVPKKMPLRLLQTHRSSNNKVLRNVGW